MRGVKRDGIARNYYPRGVYDAIPKSVFASIAWHLANLACGNDDKHAATARVLEEWDALHCNGIVPQEATKEIRAQIEMFK